MRNYSIHRKLMVEQQVPPEDINRRRTEHTIVKRKRTRGQIIIYISLHRKLMVERNEY